MTGERTVYLRLEQYYGQLLADFRRRQADITAEYDAKIASWRHRKPEPPGQGGRATFDEDDFSNNTWLR